MYLYGKRWPSLRLIASKLGCKCGRRLTRIRRRGLIVNWGRVEDFSNCPNVLNRNLICNKFRQLQILKNNDISIPKIYERYRSRISRDEFPLLGRKFSHTKGDDIVFLESIEDLENYERSDVLPDFLVQYIKKRGEYRVHVAGGEVISVSKKKKREDVEEPDKIVWSSDKGWRFIEYNPNGYIREALEQIAIESVEALNYDFGAVDIIVRDETPYVLEINSAPGMIDRRAELYADYFRRVENDLR